MESSVTPERGGSVIQLPRYKRREFKEDECLMLARQVPTVFVVHAGRIARTRVIASDKAVCVGIYEQGSYIITGDSNETSDVFTAELNGVYFEVTREGLYRHPELVQTLGSVISGFEAHAEGMRREAAETHRRMEALSADLELMQETIDNGELARFDLLREVQQLKEELARSREELAAVRTNAEADEVQIGDLLSSNAHLEDELRATIQERDDMAALNAANAANSASVTEKFEQTLERLRAAQRQITRLRGENAKLHDAAHGEPSRIEEALAPYKGEIVRLSKENMNLQEQNATLRQALHDLFEASEKARQEQSDFWKRFERFMHETGLDTLPPRAQATLLGLREEADPSPESSDAGFTLTLAFDETASTHNPSAAPSPPDHTPSGIRTQEWHVITPEKLEELKRAGKI